MIALHKNLSLDDAVRAAEERGCKVRLKPGTGDLYITHTQHTKGMRVNCRRKDTTQALISFLRKLPEPE